MPWRGDVAYLREKAKRFRELSGEYSRKGMPVGPTLDELAVDLETKADEIERREKARAGPP